MQGVQVGEVGHEEGAQFLRLEEVCGARAGADCEEDFVWGG